MSNNWKEPEPQDPSEFVEHPPFIKSDREITINNLCLALADATDPKERADLQRELLDFIEGDDAPGA